MKPTVLITESIASSGLALLEASCRCLTDWSDGGVAQFERARRLLPQADAVIVRVFPIGAADLEDAGRLRVIAKHGVGVDNIDCRAASRKRIPVLYTPGANSNAVAEHTLALMLALTRHTEEGSLAVKRAQPYRREDFVGIELAGRTLGIIGLGRIGKLVARKAGEGLGMRILAYDPYVSRDDMPTVTFCDTLDELLGAAEFVSLHVPLTEETRSMIDDQSLRLLRPTCRLINTSRGAVVDGQALSRALGDGKLAGAALDVFEEEPLPSDHPLCRAPNTVFTPHVAGATTEAMERVSKLVALGVLDILEGRSLDNHANLEMWPD